MLENLELNKSALLIYLIPTEHCLYLDWTEGLQLALAHSPHLTSYTSACKDREMSKDA